MIMTPLLSITDIHDNFSICQTVLPLSSSIFAIKPCLITQSQRQTASNGTNNHGSSPQNHGSVSRDWWEEKLWWKCSPKTHPLQKTPSKGIRWICQTWFWKARTAFNKSVKATWPIAFTPEGWQPFPSSPDPESHACPTQHSQLLSISPS